MLPFKRILAPTDFSAASEKALLVAVELARTFDARLLLLHVVEPAPTVPADFDYGFGMSGMESDLYSGAEERLQEIAESGNLLEVEPLRLVKYGEPAREVVAVAQEEKADLIVIATHGLTGWRHLVFGSVAEKVVRLAQCPVLSVRVSNDED